MSMSDPIADMLTRIRNATRVDKPDVRVRWSTVKAAIADVLKEEGYIEKVEVVDDVGILRDLRIVLKYADEESVIEGIERVSRPSRRVYVGAAEIPRVLGGLGIAIMSTPKGVITGRRARKMKVGGEVLCHVW